MKEQKAALAKIGYADILKAISPKYHTAALVYCRSRYRQMLFRGMICSILKE